MRSAIPLAACLACGAAGAQPFNPTGDVARDFPAADPAISIVVDQIRDVGLPPGIRATGFDIRDMRFLYDPLADTLYVGLQTLVIAGDADGDGDPGAAGPVLQSFNGQDLPDFGGTESFAVSFDLDQDGQFDIVVGVPSGANLAGYTVARHLPQALVPSVAFGMDLAPNVGQVFFNPSAAAPHVEFSILGFSTLPTTSGRDDSAAFNVLGFMGSFSDGPIGEDFVPAINATATVCARPGAEERCNNYDDDCDGEIDEGFPLGEACVSGLGICAQDGFHICSPGGALACSAQPGRPQMEQCDGLDNDCDGQVDEGFAVGQACSVGIGQCARAAVFICDGLGGARCDAEPGEPRPELCDALDNDCDGLADEGFGIGDSCVVGVGACEAVGTVRCLDLDASACIGEAGEPTEERCDGIDNDCDGVVDEGLPADPCPTGALGLCAAGVQECNAGVWRCAPVVQPTEERCDGLDNDCDGVADEGFQVGSACQRTEGPCVSQGLTVCAPDGAAICDAPPPVATEERCDGLDNDCDGLVDEGLDVGGRCTRGVGVCARDGVRACDGAGEVICIGETPGEPTAERCNGLDDDCDGVVDEGLGVGEPCAVGVGACRAESVSVCDSDTQVTCPAIPATPTEEVCNGVDDDCDGQVDEGFGVGVPCTVGIGYCAADGVTACASNGEVICAGEPGPPRTGEGCEPGVDDDCDGKTDEADECAPGASDPPLQVVAGTSLTDNCRSVGGGPSPGPGWLLLLLPALRRRRKARS